MVTWTTIQPSLQPGRLYCVWSPGQCFFVFFALPVYTVAKFKAYGLSLLAKAVRNRQVSFNQDMASFFRDLPSFWNTKIRIATSNPDTHSHIQDMECYQLPRYTHTYIYAHRSTLLHLHTWKMRTLISFLNNQFKTRLKF